MARIINKRNKDCLPAVLPQVRPLTKRTMKSDYWFTGRHRCVRRLDTDVSKQHWLGYAFEPVADSCNYRDDAIVAGCRVSQVEHA
jgi:hypothetical protein